MWYADIPSPSITPDLCKSLQCSHFDLVDSTAISTSAENRVLAQKRLSASSDTDQVLTSRQPLVGRQVAQESLEVAIEVADLASRHKTKDGGAAVGALVELESGVADLGRRDGRAG